MHGLQSDTKSDPYCVAHQVEKAASDVRAREAELELLAASLTEQSVAADSGKAELECRELNISSKMIVAKELEVSFDIIRYHLLD
jgi:hypothetical protein